MRTVTRALLVCAALWATAPVGTARADDTLAVQRSAQDAGGFRITGSLTTADRTWSAEEVEGLLRDYLSHPLNLAADLDEQVRAAIYRLAAEVP